MVSPAELNQLQIESYSVELPFDRLNLGVDNVRYDVFISAEFRKVSEQYIFELIMKYAEVSESLILNPDVNWFKETSEFQRLCTEILTDSVNKAKAQQEIQIDFLAQTAMVKFLTEEIQQQYEEAIQHCKNVIRRQEISHLMEATLKLREEVASIIQRKNQILRKVGAELFEYFIEVQQEVNNLRAANFGENAILPEELFSNPILHAGTGSDGFFMMEKYVLLGHRLEDPVNYNALINLLTGFLSQLDTPPELLADDEAQTSFKTYKTPYQVKVDGWIRQVDNIDKLFNYFQTQETLKELKKRYADPQKIQIEKDTFLLQKKLLNQFFGLISKENMMGGVVAAYVMNPMFHKYCPPLSPQECLQYLVVPKARKNTIRKLKRFNKYFGKSFPLYSLKNTIRRIWWTSRVSRKKLLIRFLRDFSAYHRDMKNFLLIKEASDCINVTTDEKIINLSRGNHSLYEFILSHEDLFDKKPITHHVVIKADVRGSTAIVDQMKSKNLNPASNFSLNLFDPIGKILSQYGALKVFIEGDAIILSIFEYQDSPGRGYSVARACGLALNILMIVRAYNQRNRKSRLPRLELGIGIGYAGSPPTFFYDEDNQIMISPAINDADRLSRCDKSLREQLSRQRLPFNVYEIQPKLDPDTMVLFNSKVLRYNVKGIALSPGGFRKLSREIHLEKLECLIPEIQPEPLTLYTGKFPTVAGNYQRLVIREALIPEVALKDLSMIRQTENAYYEVSTNQSVYTRVKEQVKADK
ncbi:MAG: hypothetical protein C4518_10800 [Desulfobacteraceae bacterium]|nr:MAG: hypothetical protein C4518_10800 [Desulfobacteraceae bacterium]